MAKKKATAAVNSVHNVSVCDISSRMEPGELPCCPLCDNEVLDWELCTLVSAHGAKALVHTQCLVDYVEEG